MLRLFISGKGRQALYSIHIYRIKADFLAVPIAGIECNIDDTLSCVYICTHRFLNQGAAHSLLHSALTADLYSLHFGTLNGYVLKII